MSYPTENEYKEIRSYLVMSKLFGGKDSYPNCQIIVRDVVTESRKKQKILVELERNSKETKRLLISRINADQIPIMNFLK